MLTDKNFRILKRSLLFLIAFLVCMVLFYFLSTVIISLIFAWVVALLINPLVNFLQYRGRMPRQLAVLIVLISIMSLLLGIITLFVAELIAITEYLSKRAPYHLEETFTTIEDFFVKQILPKIQLIINNISGENNQYGYSLSMQLNDLFSNFVSQVIFGLQTILSKMTGFLSWLPKAFTVFIFTIIATFFISSDWYKLKRTFDRYLPQIARERSLMVFYNLRSALFGYMRAQLTIIVISCVIVFTGLLILKSDYPLLLAVMIGILDLIPFLGPGIVLVPWMTYEWLVNNHAMALGLFVLFIVIIVTRQLIEPKIVSTNIGMNPLLTLLAIFVGWQIFGLAGVILVPACFVLIHSLYKTGVITDIWKYIQGE